MKHNFWKSLFSFNLVTVMLLGMFSAIPLSAEPAEEMLVNLFDAATAESGFYHPTTNEKKEGSGYWTDTAEVQEGDVITFGPALRSGQDFFIIGYNVSGEIVSTDFKQREILTVVDDSFRSHYLYAYTVPANVTTVRFTVPNDLKAIFTATKNQPFDAFGFYTYWNEDETRAATYLKSKRNNALLDGYSGRPFEVDENSILKGRSVLFLGDSIVSSERDTSLFYCGWAERIGVVNGMDYVNNGKSGATFSTKKTNRIVSNLTTTGRPTFDYIITNGGVNDAWMSAPVGKMSNSFWIEDFDITTFAGALEEFFFYTREIYPSAIVGYICTFSMPSATGGNVATPGAYYDVAKQICNKWGVHCLDLYTNTEFCKNVLKTDTTTYLADHVHPNGAGVDLIYPLIEEWMKSLPHPDNPKKETPEFPDEPIEDKTTTESLDTTISENETTDGDTTSDKKTFSLGCASAVAPIMMPLVAVSTGVSLMLKRKNGKEYKK